MTARGVPDARTRRRQRPAQRGGSSAAVAPSAERAELPETNGRRPSAETRSASAPGRGRDPDAAGFAADRSLGPSQPPGAAGSPAFQEKTARLVCPCALPAAHAPGNPARFRRCAHRLPYGWNALLCRRGDPLPAAAPPAQRAGNRRGNGKKSKERRKTAT